MKEMYIKNEYNVNVSRLNLVFDFYYPTSFITFPAYAFK